MAFYNRTLDFPHWQFIRCCGNGGRSLLIVSSSQPHGVVMSAADRKAEYVAKAKEAEEQAERTKDEVSKASWLRIAAGYHDLAARQEAPK